MVQSGVSLMEEIIKEKLDELTKAIDNDVMRACLVDSGWTEVSFYYNNNKHAIDVLEWIGNNVKENQWSRLNGYFVFRNKKDAQWFMLRWL